MTTILSKRQQARNEAVLHDLVHSVPGNNHCADCFARNPAWASWSLGVFLCMRCAAIHRKLGTHISKVKSLSMDSWTNEQVDNMRKVGNLVSNKIYNAENKKPPIPVDADEVDSAMERFIRQKYIISVGGQSGKKKPFLDEGTPPPLPPKNSKFGFRSASSIFPLSSKSRKEVKATSHKARDGGVSLSLANKQSKVFGATVDYGEDDMEKKMSRLLDMGFQDEHRNAMILKGVNGNLERAVEALVRIGDGDRHSPGPGATSTDGAFPGSRSLTPVPPDSGVFGAGPSISGRPATTQDRPTTALTPSTNPFDIMPPAPPQTAYSTGTLQNNNPYMTSMNPFGAPPQQTDFRQAFENLSLLPAQPLFPHHTGGVVSQHSQYSHQFPRYQSPASSTPSFAQTYQGAGFQGSMTYPQPVPQPLMVQQTGLNPFLSQQQTSPFGPQSQQAISISTAQAQGQPAYGSNPFARSPTRISSPPLTQIPEQCQPTMFQAPLPLQPQHSSTNPFLTDQSTMQFAMLMGQQAPGYQQHQQHQQPQQQQQFWQPKRQDKASILALYSQAQPAQALRALPNPTLPAQASMVVGDSATQSMQEVMPMQQQQSRSLSQPLPGGTNPFMKNGNVPLASDVFAADRKTSRESVSLGMDMAWTNGRHSPDAFASLSARHR